MRALLAGFAALALALPGCARREVEWVAVAPEDGSFRAEIPGPARKVEHSLDTPVGPAPVEIWLNQDGERAFMVGYTEYPEKVRGVASPEELLDSARDGAVAQVAGKLLIDEPRELGELRGKRIAIDADGGRVRVRGDLFVVGRRLYQVLATTAPEDTDSAEVTRFLDSFRLLPRSDAETHVEVK
jgi:hypothetical protein